MSGQYAPAPAVRSLRGTGGGRGSRPASVPAVPMRTRPLRKQEREDRRQEMNGGRPEVRTVLSKIPPHGRTERPFAHPMAGVIQPPAGSRWRTARRAVPTRPYPRLRERILPSLESCPSCKSCQNPNRPKTPFDQFPAGGTSRVRGRASWPNPPRVAASGVPPQAGRQSPPATMEPNSPDGSESRPYLQPDSPAPSVLLRLSF